MTTIAPGVTLAPNYLDRPAQDDLLVAVRADAMEIPVRAFVVAATSSA